MRAISDALKTEQEAASNTPYIKIYIGGVDYSPRLLYLEHHEEAYRDRCNIILRNDDLSLNDTDLVGKMFYPGYGYITGNAVAEPNGNNDTAEYSYAAPLWVKSQWFTSMEGVLVCQLYCEGAWMKLREQRIMAYGSAPYYDFIFGATYTIYGLIEELIESAMGWDLAVSPSPDDGILNDFSPVFNVNEMPYENAAALLYRLISMTKCYIRLRTVYGVGYALTQIIYPQTSDSANETYYSYQSPYFKEYNEKTNLLIPNNIAVFCNQDSDGGWDNAIVGLAEDIDERLKYEEVLEPYIDGTITTLANANARAAAILTRIKAEQLAGRLVLPFHDCRMELYDKVEIYDTRGI